MGNLTSVLLPLVVAVAVDFPQFLVLLLTLRAAEVRTLGALTSKLGATLVGTILVEAAEVTEDRTGIAEAETIECSEILGVQTSDTYIMNIRVMTFDLHQVSNRINEMKK